MTTDQMIRLLAVGYDGVVAGRAAMGSTRAPEFMRAVRDRTLLPADSANGASTNSSLMWMAI